MRTIVFRGGPTPLSGNEIRVGDQAPDVTLVDRDLNTRRLSEFSGKVRILSVVPSLDTGVCDAQTRRFNELGNELGPEAAVITVSMDLPFAQKRWCGNAGLESAVTLSDHRDAAFGHAYGTLMQDYRLEARAVFVVDRQDRVVHVQYVPDAGQHPDYDRALEAARAALGQA